MKFTKEEISLCKQIAKKHKKPIGFGDWFWIDSTGQYLFAKEDEPFTSSSLEPTTPLWTISDCLEFLEKRDWLVDLKISSTPKYGKYYLACYMPREHPNRKHGIYKYANTRLEACLKAVLAVLEVGK